VIFGCVYGGFFLDTLISSLIIANWIGIHGWMAGKCRKKEQEKGDKRKEPSQRRC
jgi:hypothetical protein